MSVTVEACIDNETNLYGFWRLAIKDVKGRWNRLTPATSHEVGRLFGYGIIRLKLSKRKMPRGKSAVLRRRKDVKRFILWRNADLCVSWMRRFGFEVGDTVWIRKEK